MKYQIGDICFVKDTSNWLGRIIDYYNLANFKQSNATHVFIITNIIDENTLEIAEAGAKGVQIYNTNISYLDKLIVKRSTTPLFLVREIAKKYEGKPYGFDSYIEILLKFLGMKMNMDLGSSSVICSELVARILYECSQKIIDLEKEYPDYSFDEICPEQIYESKYLVNI